MNFRLYVCHFIFQKTRYTAADSEAVVSTLTMAE